jgi:putative hydrolase of the HAD superfamily
MSEIKYILFDAANTIIHKPLLWQKLDKVLKDFGHEVQPNLLKHNHKLLSESINFPDRTSSNFYRTFNSELLYSLGIIPDDAILKNIFQECTYLPWEKFSDSSALEKLKLPIGIVSNFNNSLVATIEKEFGTIFSRIIISESYGKRKPDQEFYKIAVNELDLNPENILYIGDSIKLDIEPASKLGINAVLIDRDNVYPLFNKRIVSLEQLDQFL